jgi:SAM-dependent methyltransferase
MNDKHLDLGCGDAPRNPYRRASLVGVDVRASSSQDLDDFAVANLFIEPIPFADDSFQSVSAFDFLEHVPRILMGTDGRSTRFAFVEVMNEVWRVLQPGGRLYALTPAFPRPEAFQDPTHCNIITDRTHEYFCGTEPLGRMYGFKGAFKRLRAQWAALPEDFVAQRPDMSWKRAYKHRRDVRLGRTSHFLWELEADKPVGART